MFHKVAAAFKGFRVKVTGLCLCVRASQKVALSFFGRLCICGISGGLHVADVSKFRRWLGTLIASAYLLMMVSHVCSSWRASAQGES